MNYYGQLSNALQNSTQTAITNFHGEATEAAESPCSRALGMLVTNIAELEQAFAILAEKISPVAPSQPKPAQGQSNPPRQSYGPVVDAIATSTERIADIRQNMNDLRSNIVV